MKKKLLLEKWEAKLKENDKKAKIWFPKDKPLVRKADCLLILSLVFFTVAITPMYVQIVFQITFNITNFCALYGTIMGFLCVFVAHIKYNKNKNREFVKWLIENVWETRK